MANTTTTQTTKELNIFHGNNPTNLVLGGAQIFKTVQNLTAMDVDYETLKLDAGFKENQALNIEFQAQQEANYLRDQFTEQVGNYQYGTARRNVKIGEAGSNIEDSSRDLGIDMAKIKGNADFKAQQLRAEADRIRAGAEGIHATNMWNRIGGLFDGFNKTVEIFKGLEWTDKKAEVVQPPAKDVKPPVAKTPETTKKPNVPVPKMEMPELSTGPAVTDLTAKTTSANPKQGKQTSDQIAAVDSPEVYRVAAALNIEPTKVSGVMMAKAKGKTASQIAKEFGLTQTQVASIINPNEGTW